MADKQSKAAVNYRRGSRNTCCALCTMWRAPHGCTAVEGKIEPGDLCDIFQRAHLQRPATRLGKM